jgi:TatD DNase family protein
MRVCRLLPAAAAVATKSRVLSFSTTGPARSRVTSRMASALIDVDCNLWHDDLRSLQNNQNASMLTILEEDAVCESNVVAMLSPSSTLHQARMGLEILSSTATTIPILTTVGVHPYHVNDEGASLEQDVESIKELVTRPFVCAVGECGLDASEGFPPLDDQLPWFRAQVQLAQTHNKALFVHERLAFEETMQILESCTVPVIIHCFTGSRDECKQYVKRGYSLSISGYIFKDTETRVCLEDGLIPLDKLMIETDAPYMGFEDCRVNYLEKQVDYVASLNSKKRKRLQNSIYPNVPSSLPIVLTEVVKLLNDGRAKRGEVMLKRDEVARMTTENAICFFGFEGITL